MEQRDDPLITGGVGGILESGGYRRSKDSLLAPEVSLWNMVIVP